MILRYVLIATVLSIFELSGLAAINPVFASPCSRENLQDQRFTRYKWRGNRCEGLIGYPASGPPEIVSFSINSLRVSGQGHGKTSVIVRNLSSLHPARISIHAFLSSEKYVMDKFDPGKPFSWNTSEVMQKAGIRPQDLSAFAIAHDNGRDIYLPVELGGKTKSYEFGFRANADFKFLSIAVQDYSGKTIKNLDTGAMQRKRNVVIRHWDGTGLDGRRRAKGQYQLVYKGYVEQRDGRPVPFSDSIKFEHDPSWLVQ